MIPLVAIPSACTSVNFIDGLNVAILLKYACLGECTNRLRNSMCIDKLKSGKEQASTS